MNSGNPSFANDDWDPTKVSLVCGLKSCPLQVGVLIFPVRSGGLVDVYRCTAFLIDNDKIMSNGHCDNPGAREGYFITRTDIPQRAIRHVTQRLFKAFTPALDKNGKVDPEDTSGRPDVLVFQLDVPIATIPPLHLAHGPAKTYQTLTGYVANLIPGKSFTTMAIGQVTCAVHRNELQFPYNLSESPDMLTVYKCNAEKGNSGSPMFAEGSADVEAILQGSADVDGTAAAIRHDEKREPHDYEIQHNIIATNLRCLDYPSASGNHCVSVTDDESVTRFNALINSMRASLAARPAPGTFPTEFKVLSMELKTQLVQPETEFEDFYYPTCSTHSLGSSLAFPSELVKMEFDEWGEPSIKTLKEESSTGSVTHQFSNGVSVKMNWQPPFGPYDIPSNDPRTQLGNSFSIALPGCSS